MHKIVLAALLALATVNVNAQHHGNAVVTENPQPKEEQASTVLRSHVKQIGVIGDRYEVHSIRIRGLDSPNLTAGVIFDKATGQLLVVGTAGAPGLGGALIGAAGEVGSSFVFGRAIRPDRTSVSNSSNGGTTTAEGGVAVSNSESDAKAKASSTNVNVNSTDVSNTATGGTGQHVPPGHIDNPSHNN